MRIRASVTVSIAALAVLASACSSGSSPPTGQGSSAASGAAGTPSSSHAAASPTQGAVPVQSPVPVESNPPGDIPDNTQFVPFRSASGHFVVKVPEGWSRRSTKSSVSFTDKLNTVEVTWSRSQAAPTPRSAKSKDVPALRRSVLAFTLSRIVDCAPSCTIPYSTAPISVSLPAHAVVVTFRGNSKANSVTGKQYRLEELRFEFFRGHEMAALTLSGPVGSDNVDPWTLVSESFGWR